MPKRSTGGPKKRRTPAAADAEPGDNGLALKIGQMLVRIMSRAAPIDEPRPPAPGRAPPKAPEPRKPLVQPVAPNLTKAPPPRRDSSAQTTGKRRSGALPPLVPSRPGAFGRPKTRAADPPRIDDRLPASNAEERVRVAPRPAPTEPIEITESPFQESPDEATETAAPLEDTPDEVEEKPVRPRLSGAARRYAALIEQTLAELGTPGHVVHAETGPMLLRFGVAPGYLIKSARGDQPARRERVRAARIVARTNDLALALGVTSLRIEAPVPGKTYIGLEIPNPNPKTVPLAQLLDDPAFQTQLQRSILPVALGRDVAGQPILADLARLPHLLIAGATGAGKSVAVNSLLGAILRTRAPADVRVIVVDPKRVEFNWLAGIPHLLTPVVTEIEQAVEVLGKAETEMAHRYDLLANAGCRNRVAYNASHQPGLPALVVVIDELADLMMMASEDVERSVCRLAQLGRAAGIHLVVATQRPSVDVVTGLIKANLPARLAFAVSSMVDSRTILDMPGAERLLGRGDFLFLAPDAMRPVRGQGAFSKDPWLAQLVKTAKAAAPVGAADPEAERFKKLLSATQMADDRLFGSAKALAQEHPRVSASFLQRKMRIGYPKAVALIERLRADGIIADPDLDGDD